MKEPYLDPPSPEAMARYFAAQSELSNALARCLGITYNMLIDLGTDCGTTAAIVTFEDGKIVMTPIDLYDESGTIPLAAWDRLSEPEEKG